MFTIHCNNCEDNTLNRQIAPDCYECTKCGKRQENVRFCQQCTMMTKHDKDTISDNCSICGNNPERPIEDFRMDDWEPGIIQKKERVKRDDQTIICQHGTFYKTHGCRRCRAIERTGGGFSVRRKIA